MEILITESAYNAPGVKEIIQVDALPPIVLRGLSSPVNLYRVH